MPVRRRAGLPPHRRPADHPGAWAAGDAAGRCASCSHRSTLPTGGGTVVPGPFQRLDQVLVKVDRPVSRAHRQASVRHHDLAGTHHPSIP